MWRKLPGDGNSASVNFKLHLHGRSQVRLSQVWAVSHPYSTYPELNLANSTSFQGPINATRIMMSTTTADTFDIIPGVKVFHHGMTANRERIEAIITIDDHQDWLAIKPTAAAKKPIIASSQKMPKTLPRTD